MTRGSAREWAVPLVIISADCGDFGGSSRASIREACLEIVCVDLELQRRTREYTVQPKPRHTNA